MPLNRFASRWTCSPKPWPTAYSNRKKTMAAFDLEEQEQISQIKGWWEQYGKLVTTLAVAAALASVGWQGWNWHKGKQAAEASALYDQLQVAAAERNATKVRELAGSLLEKFSGTAYA